MEKRQETERQVGDETPEEATDTATGTAEETGAEPGGQAKMRPTGSGGSAPPEE